jgi:hypothetical protein
MSNPIQRIPDVLLDDEGYPTEEWLSFIKNYRPDNSVTIMDFVEALIDSWYHQAYKLGRKYKNERKLELHTLGWSGNEDIIHAVLSNIYITFAHMKYYQWKTGGHYYFKIRLKLQK